MTLLHPLAPISRQRSRQLVERLIENVVSSEGIYYCLLQSEGWELYGYRFDDYPQIDHISFWERFVVPTLAHRWARRLNVDAVALERAMRPFPYALPRGRVVHNSTRQWVVYHGGEKVSPVRMVQRIFGLAARVRWETDEHERCQHAEKEQFRRLVCAGLDWPAV